MSSVDHREVVMLLNELLATDPRAIAALVSHRVPCGPSLALHGGVETERDYATGKGKVGFLGILNGFFGLSEDGRGKIVVITDETGQLMAFAEADDGP